MPGHNDAADSSLIKLLLKHLIDGIHQITVLLKRLILRVIFFDLFGGAKQKART